MSLRSNSMWAKMLSFTLAAAFMAAGTLAATGSAPASPDETQPVIGTGDADISVEGVSVSDPAPVAGTQVTVTATMLGDASVSSEWVKSGVVLDIGGWGEDLHVSCPSVLRLENGTYLMFYTAKMNDGASTSWYWRMFRAFSYDGLAWHKEGKVLDYGGAYAGNAVYNPYVWIAPDGTYHMWYCGQTYESGNRARVLHATSPDGYAFVYDRLEINFGSPIEPASVNCPFVLAEDNGFRMWYQGTAWSPLLNWINQAHKSNLADAWIKDGTVLLNNGPYDNPHAQRPWVLPTDGGYEMFYSGSDPYGVGRILHASSSDGISWTKDGIVLEPSLPQEGIVVRYSSVLREGDTYKMWYNGYNGTNRIMYAEKAPAHVGQDATCTVNFYLDSVSPESLIGTQENVFVPADGTAQASISWTSVGGEHQVIAVATDVSPADPDLSDNEAEIEVSVSEPEPVGTVDLAVYSAGIFMPTGIEAGEQVTIEATIQNIGGSQGAWEKQGVVLSPGASAQYPYVIKDGPIYKMWYTGYGATYDIYYATSTDRVTWTNYGKVLAHPAGTTYAAAPSVIKEADGTYKMWYSCQNYNWNSEIYYATSVNGITWTQLGKVLPIGPAGSFDSVYACQGYVFKDAGIYKMYYKAYDSALVSRFGLATSTDGISWTKHGAVMNTPAGYAAMECPFALIGEDGSYVMWFNTGKIMKSTSQDGTTWSPATVDLDVTSGTSDSRAVYTPMVLREADGTYMYYAGDSGSTSYIFLAEMATPGLDATCTVSFYLDSVSAGNLVGSVSNVYVPVGGETQVSIDWIPVAGEHEILVVVSDVNPADIDLSNNQASAPVSVSEPEPLPAALEIEKVKLSGIDGGYTLTYYEWELLITVSNTGGSTLEGVEVKDVLPAELQLLVMNASIGSATYVDDVVEDQTRAAPAPPTVYPVKSTHICWDVGTLEPGQAETLYLKVGTRINPGGNQEFTSPGTYYINEGAIATGTDSLTGDTLTGQSQPITVIISEPVLGDTLPVPIDGTALAELPGSKALKWAWAGASEKSIC